jgi:hypothetical protein
VTSSSCSISCTRRVTLVKHLVVSHEWGKERIAITTKEAYPWLFVTQIFHQLINILYNYLTEVNIYILWGTNIFFIVSISFVVSMNNNLGGKERIAITTKEAYLWLFVTQIFRNGSLNISIKNELFLIYLICVFLCCCWNTHLEQ